MKKKDNKSVKLRRRILLFGFISFVIIFVVSYNVLSIVNQIVSKYREASELEEKLVALEEEEEDLNNEILKLQDTDYLARYAREKYFYSKNGELIIRIPSNDD